jgi:hypothetical protein
MPDLPEVGAVNALPGFQYWVFWQLSSPIMVSISFFQDSIATAHPDPFIHRL